MAACFFQNGEHSEGNAVVDSCRVPDPVSCSQQVLSCWNSLSELHYVVDIWNGFPVSADCGSCLRVGGWSFIIRGVVG